MKSNNLNDNFNKSVVQARKISHKKTQKSPYSHNKYRD